MNPSPMPISTYQVAPKSPTLARTGGVLLARNSLPERTLIWGTPNSSAADPSTPAACRARAASGASESAALWVEDGVATSPSRAPTTTVSQPQLARRNSCLASTVVRRTPKLRRTVTWGSPTATFSPVPVRAAPTRTRTVSNLSQASTNGVCASAPTAGAPPSPSLRYMSMPDRCPSYLSLGTAFPMSRNVSLTSMASASPTNTTGFPLQRIIFET